MHLSPVSDKKTLKRENTVRAAVKDLSKLLHVAKDDVQAVWFCEQIVSLQVVEKPYDQLFVFVGKGLEKGVDVLQSGLTDVPIPILHQVDFNEGQGGIIIYAVEPVYLSGIIYGLIGDAKGVDTVKAPVWVLKKPQRLLKGLHAHMQQTQFHPPPVNEQNCYH